MREKDVRGSLDAAVEEVMEPGPTTVRSSEAAEGLLKRMRKRNVPTVMVTTSKDGLWSGDTGGSGEAGDATRSSECAGTYAVKRLTVSTDNAYKRILPAVSQ